MHNPSHTNPGLLYDPRHDSVGKFFASLEKELATQKVPGLSRGPVPKPKDYHKPQPLPDWGPPASFVSVNPMYTMKSGFTARV